MKDKLIEKYLFNTLNDEETKLFLELKNNERILLDFIDILERLQIPCKKP